MQSHKKPKPVLNNWNLSKKKQKLKTQTLWAVCGVENFLACLIVIAIVRSMLIDANNIEEQWVKK